MTDSSDRAFCFFEEHRYLGQESLFRPKRVRHAPRRPSAPDVLKNRRRPTTLAVSSYRAPKVLLKAFAGAWSERWDGFALLIWLPPSSQNRWRKMRGRYPTGEALHFHNR